MELKRTLLIFIISCCSMYFYNSKTKNNFFYSKNTISNTEEKIQAEHHPKIKKTFTLEKSDRVDTLNESYHGLEENVSPLISQAETEEDLEALFKLLNQFHQDEMAVDADYVTQIEKLLEKSLSSNQYFVEKALALVVSNMDAPNSYTIRHILYKLEPEKIKAFAIDLAKTGSLQEKLAALNMVSEFPKSVEISPAEIENILVFSEDDSSVLSSTISALHLDYSDKTIDQYEIIVEELKDLLNHTTQREKALTILSRLKFNDLGLQNQVIEALNDESTSIQHIAITTLLKNKKNHPATQEVLIEKMQNQNTEWMVRAAAWYALADFSLNPTNKELIEHYRGVFSGEEE